MLDKGVDAGDVAVLAVFAVFGLLCAMLGWRLLRDNAASPVASAPRIEPASAMPTKRVTISQGCAAAGVVLVILSVLLPADWYRAGSFFAGLALLAISHGLTPCVERIEQLRKARDSMRQL